MKPIAPWERPKYRPLHCPECLKEFQPLGAGHMQGCTTGSMYQVPDLVKDGWPFLVFGGRDIPLDIKPKIWTFLDDVLAKHPDLVLIHGGAQGVDLTAAQWAKENGVAEELWRPQYDLFKKWLAPFWRNAEMAARKPEGAVGFIGPCVSTWCKTAYPHGTHGSVDMAVRACALGVPVFPIVRGGLDQLATWIMSGETPRTSCPAR